MDTLQDQPLGKLSYYLQESDQAFDLQQARAAFQQNLFTPAHSSVLTFGIGAAPVWVSLSVDNQQHQQQIRTLVIDTSWLDQIQLYIRHRGTGETQHYQTGDDYPFYQRPISSRDFRFALKFAPGISDIFIRVATPDPLVLPIYLLNENQVHGMNTLSQYSYGLGYGYLIALIAYNAMLFFGLGDRRYLLYSIYLATFTVTNLSYTGHGFMWLWPQSPDWQRWGQPILMLLTASTGLAFALKFLDIKKYSLRIYYLVVSAIALALTVLIIAFSLHDQSVALLTAFVFVFALAIIMLLLGITGLIHRNPSARYFLLAVVIGAIGISTTAAAAWGLIPFTQWTFRAAEIGMLSEATLLALALAYRFRYSEKQKLAAEQLSMLDHLTKLDNRRSFHIKAEVAWQNSKRYQRNLSIILFDLDDFKALNDTFGHSGGDQALIATADMLLESIRKGDTAARWGGEEFLLLLPQSCLEEAEQFSFRLREKIEAIQIKHNSQNISFTASFGVAQQSKDEHSIETLIAKADEALYEAKSKGKNQVVTYT
jgi:two-component system, sensor histidine kinase LadS